jgi:mannose-6-phosphate isomerase-like protein (cupin superfamily)
MFHHLKAAQFIAGGERTAHFDGEAFDAGISFFDVDIRPGVGPPLHRHAYAETWIIKNGNVEFTVDCKKAFAKSGDIVVVPAFTPHKFVSCGSDRLRMVCIHATSKIEQENLTEPSETI